MKTRGMRAGSNLKVIALHFVASSTVFSIFTLMSEWLYADPEPNPAYVANLIERENKILDYYLLSEKPLTTNEIDKIISNLSSKPQINIGGFTSLTSFTNRLYGAEPSYIRTVLATRWQELHEKNHPKLAYPPPASEKAVQTNFFSKADKNIAERRTAEARRYASKEESAALVDIFGRKEEAMDFDKASKRLALLSSEKTIKTYANPFYGQSQQEIAAKFVSKFGGKDGIESDRVRQLFGTTRDIAQFQNRYLPSASSISKTPENNKTPDATNVSKGISSVTYGPTPKNVPPSLALVGRDNRDLQKNNASGFNLITGINPLGQRPITSARPTAPKTTGTEPAPAANQPDLAIPDANPQNLQLGALRATSPAKTVANPSPTSPSSTTKPPAGAFDSEFDVGNLLEAMGTSSRSNPKMMDPESYKEPPKSLAELREESKNLSLIDKLKFWQSEDSKIESTIKSEKKSLATRENIINHNLGVIENQGDKLFSFAERLENGTASKEEIRNFDLNIETQLRAKGILTQVDDSNRHEYLDPLLNKLGTDQKDLIYSRDEARKTIAEYDQSLRGNDYNSQIKQESNTTQNQWNLQIDSKADPTSGMNAAEQTLLQRHKKTVTRNSYVEKKDIVTTDAPVTTRSDDDDDSCWLSSQATGDRKQCKTTIKHLDQSAAVNQTGQALGAAAVGVQGTIQQGKALQDGTASAALKAQASTAKFSANLSGMLGATNAYYAMRLNEDRKKHGKTAEALESTARGEYQFNVNREIKTEDDSLTAGQNQGQFGYGQAGQGVVGVDPNMQGPVDANRPPNSDKYANNIVTNMKLNERYDIRGNGLAQIEQGTFEQSYLIDYCKKNPDDENCVQNLSNKQRRMNAADVKEKSMKQDIAEVAEQAAAQQQDMAQAAEEGMAQSIIEAAKGAMNYVLGNKYAKELSEAAKKLRTPDQTGLFRFDPISPSAESTSNSTNPSNLSDQTAALGEVAQNDGPEFPDLGAPLPQGLGDTVDNNLPVAPLDPSQGAQNLGNPAQLPGLGSGSTSPSDSAGASEGARYAGFGGTANSAYSGAGGGGRAIASSGGGGGGRQSSGGFDPSSLFAKFGQKDESDLKKNDILKYAGRGPAQEMEIGSLLGKDEDLFGRLHEAYRLAQKKGVLR